MYSISALFDDTMIECIATGRTPAVRELFHVAKSIWLESGANRSAFCWNSLAPTDADKLRSLRAAHIALMGS